MKNLNRKELMKRLDRLRQTYARYENAKKKNGVWMNTCVTCGRPIRCDKANGGHFIGRGCIPLRWDKRNVHCQCPGCNLYRNGAYIEYSQWFINEYGQDVFDIYVNKYKSWKQGKLPALTMPELRELYNYWLKEGRELEKKVGQLFPKTWAPTAPDFIEEI